MNVAWKRRVRQIICGLAMCMVAVLALPGMESEAAANKPACVKKQTVYMTRHVPPKRVSSNVVGYTDYMNTVLSSQIFIKNLSADAKITNIKSSNRRIKVTNGYNTSELNRFKGLYVSVKEYRPGDKSKISFKVKQNGKTYSLSCTVTVKMQLSVFSKVSIGGKNYASKLKGYGVRELTLPKNKKVKISVKMKSGAKLSSIVILNNKGTEIKNGQSVKLKKGDRLLITYKYTKKPANYSGYINKSIKDNALYEAVMIYIK